MSGKAFKLVLVGDGGVGKTTFIKRHLTGEFSVRYDPTLGMEVHPLTFHTNRGTITFNAFDISGVEKFSGLREGYFKKADCCIAMFDLTSLRSGKSIAWHVREVEDNVDAPIQVVVCGNKCDVKDVKVDTPKMKRTVAGDHFYIDISAKSNYNFEKPFLYLARRLMDDQDLEFIAAPAIVPPEVKIPEPTPLKKASDDLVDAFKVFLHELTESKK